MAAGCSGMADGEPRQGGWRGVPLRSSTQS